MYVFICFLQLRHRAFRSLGSKPPAARLPVPRRANLPSMEGIAAGYTLMPVFGHRHIRIQRPTTFSSIPGRRILAHRTDRPTDESPQLASSAFRFPVLRDPQLEPGGKGGRRRINPNIRRRKTGWMGHLGIFAVFGPLQTQFTCLSVTPLPSNAMMEAAVLVTGPFLEGNQGHRGIYMEFLAVFRHGL